MKEIPHFSLAFGMTPVIPPNKSVIPRPHLKKMGHDAIMTGSTSKGNRRDSSLRFAAFGMTPECWQKGVSRGGFTAPTHPSPQAKVAFRHEVRNLFIRQTYKSVIGKRSEESLEDHSNGISPLQTEMIIEERYFFKINIIY